MKQQKKIIGSNAFVIQGKIGSGGNNTYFIDNKNKFDKYSSLCNNQYFISKYLKHLPVNSTIIVNKFDSINFPSSVQLISLKEDKFNYVGADFIYYQTLNEEIKDKIKTYNNIIVTN
ncbi:MAG: hypothetical protein ACI31R_06290 [Bacilli bacterium]